MSRYAVSDLHGHYNLYKQIKEYLKPDDIVYCLGDCGDRGPMGWETIKAVYNDPQFEYILGNHENMLMDAMRAYHNNESYSTSYLTLSMNGGIPTFESWLQEGADPEWIGRFDYLSVVTRVEGDIYLSHAGFTPPLSAALKKRDFLWDRTHYLEDSDSEFEGLVVHGHTPIKYMIEDFKFYGITNYEQRVKDGALWYSGGRKVNIDCGTFMTKRTVLLNLDTFEEVIFYDT